MFEFSLVILLEPGLANSSVMLLNIKANFHEKKLQVSPRLIEPTVAMATAEDNEVGQDK